MRVKKKISFPLLAAAFLAVFLFGGCRPGTWGTSTLSKEVVITDIAANDLGQAMVFSEDKDGGRAVFVKNFYDQKKSRAAIRSEISEYIRELEKYRGRSVTVRYYKDEAGDLVVIDIR
jgi:hypothetical protein